MTGAGGGVVGERVILRGAMENGVFAAQEVKLDTVIAAGDVQRLSVEAWVSARDGVLTTANGIRVEDSAGALASGSHHVVINGEIGINGALIVRTVSYANGNGGFSPPSGPRGPGGGGHGPAGPGGGSRGGMNGPGGPARPGGAIGGGNKGPAGAAAPGGLPSLQPGGGFGAC